jgi:hypothetical protein
MAATPVFVFPVFFCLLFDTFFYSPKTISCPTLSVMIAAISSQHPPEGDINPIAATAPEKGAGFNCL